MQFHDDPNRTPAFDGPFAAAMVETVRRKRARGFVLGETPCYRLRDTDRLCGWTGCVDRLR